jgi:hypothetical protein
MSDVPRIGEAGPFDPAEDELATALRAALHREADRVVPAADGLQRIQREIRTRSSRGRRPVAWFGRLAPALTAAAAVMVLAVAGAVAVRLNQSPAGSGPPASGPSTTASSEAPSGQVPVYVIGTQGGRKWLFREFRPTHAVTPDDKVAEAVTDAVTDRPSDPDYDPPLFEGSPNSVATATVTPSLITVTLSAAMVSRPDVTRADARLALEQLVWTATAAAGATADTPVLIRVDHGTQSLFGQLPLGQQYTRGGFSPNPCAPLWITSLVEGTDVGHNPFEVHGDAVVGDGGSITWTLTRDGAQVGAGDALLDPPAGTRRGWTVTPPTQGRAGHYRLTVQLQPGPGSGLSATAQWQDSRNFVVR